MIAGVYLIQNLTVCLHSTGRSHDFYFSPLFQPSAPHLLCVQVDMLGLCPPSVGSQASQEASPFKGFAASSAAFVLVSKPQNLFFFKRVTLLSYKRDLYPWGNLKCLFCC